LEEKVARGFSECFVNMNRKYRYAQPISNIRIVLSKSHVNAVRQVGNCIRV